jgi:cupin 2 domain-containing protein
MAHHGELADGSQAPVSGERVIELAHAPGFRVEQILSGRLDAPVEYSQDHDEWVVVLAGGAVLDVDGAPHELRAGDWWFLPAGTPHRLVRTEPGTSWLTVTNQHAGR